MTNAQLDVLKVYMKEREQNRGAWQTSVFQAVVVFVSIVVPLSLSLDCSGVVGWVLFSSIVFAVVSVISGLYYTHVPTTNLDRVVESGCRAIVSGISHAKFSSVYTAFEIFTGKMFIVSFLVSVVLLLIAMLLRQCGL